MFPEAGPIFQRPFCLQESAQTWAGIAFCAAGQSGRNLPAATKFAGKPSQQGISSGKFQGIVYTGSMSAPSCELWRSHNAIFMRTSLTFTRVPVKVPHLHQSSGEGAFRMRVAFRMSKEFRTATAFLSFLRNASDKAVSWVRMLPERVPGDKFLF